MFEMTARARFPFRLKLTLLVAVLSVGPAIVVGVALIDVNERALERESKAREIALADDVARAVDDEVSATRTALELLARVLGDASTDENVRLALPAALVEREPTLNLVAIYDSDGALIDTVREPSAEDASMPNRLSRSIRDDAAANGIHHGALRTYAARHRSEPDPPSRSALAVTPPPRALAVVPIRADGRVTGYVAGFSTLETVQARVERLADVHLAPLEGTLFVVDDALRIVAHPDVERAHALESARGEPILRGVHPRALRGRVARSGEMDDERGEAIIGTVVGIESRPWAVVVEVPRSTAYASLAQMRRIVITTTVITALLGLLASFVGARLVTAPLAKLTAFANHLAERRFDRRVEVSTRDELALLAEALSRAAADLGASEERITKEAAIRADLGRYLPAEIVERVVRREHEMDLGGVRRPITVVFADVVAFTPLTEKLPPEDVVALLNELFTVLTELVFRHGGTVDKFVGDCVMAIFGAPTDLPDHARRALECAEDMLRWLETANAGWQDRYGVTIQLAIGVHTGDAVVGNVGSERRMEYTAIGDVVNVAARLETIARPQQILVSKETRDAAGEGFDYASLGERVLSGRAEPIELWEVRT